ncbi:hypothetical protein GCM10011611_56140 [Aliidongia dinghuensis]|uniref:HutD family protein n=1 Tax=Aliidongia dinghuensis TaxID=1867774 RepID=A0A8J2YZV9_9PROT|nr:HutD family protein [Aliidongia dinghuensis]GGF42474.1 hypothetical protein GCM10011611_56140 [Aliidongia dinghuensis]
MEVIRAAQCRTMPWKNGGGSTTEIAADPPGASLDAFDWRVSMARVASNGPFSHFAGIDRTLAVVEGEGIELTIDGGPPVALTRDAPPLSFPGDKPTAATLAAGPITDLNVMSRRGRYGHRLTRLAGAEALPGEDGIDVVIVLAVHGEAMVEAEDASAALGAGDAAILHRPAAGAVRFVPRAEAVAYLIVLRADR